MALVKTMPLHGCDDDGNFRIHHMTVPIATRILITHLGQTIRLYNGHVGR